MNKNPYKFEGYVLRIHSRNKDPLDTTGSLDFGGRWNRKNRYGAIYTSLDRKILRAEFMKMVKARGIEVEDLFERSVSTVEIKLKNVLDLTDSENRKKFGIKLSDIVSDEEDSIEKCLKAADKARELSFEAILSPSAADPEGKNLNIYPDKLSKGSNIKKVRTERLTRI